MAPQIKRQTAVKIWISNLLNGTYTKQEGEFEPNYIEVNEKQVGRVNLIANVVFRFQSEDGSYLSLTLDDGSSQIRVKAWNEATDILKGIQVGDLINIIGRPRKFNEEIYVVPEIAKKMGDFNWETARRLELFKEYGKPVNIDFTKQAITKEENGFSNKSDVVEEKIEDSDDRQKILDLIEKLGMENGVETEDIINKSGMDNEVVEEIILDLLKNGEIYEPKPNVLRIL